MATNSDAFDFGLRLKKIREENHLTQQEFADRLGINRVTVGSFEQNLYPPKLPVLKKICLEFHVTPAYLLGLDDNAAITTTGLNELEIEMLRTLARILSEKKKHSDEG